MDDILASIRRRIAALQLDLTGLTVLTEAATGAYAVTAVIAAMAGAAQVHAVARDTKRHGRFEDAAKATIGLAAHAGVAERINVTGSATSDILQECDIVTNSGHLRPIGRSMIDRLPDRAVIGLMYEGWEFRGADIDLSVCRERGIRIAAVNERHPDVGVFAFLGPLCVRLLADAGLNPPGRRIALLCDNPFAPFLRAGLLQAGASVTLSDSVSSLPAASWDAIVVALDPARTPVLGESDMARLATVAPGTCIAQFWGDVDRASAARRGIQVWPRIEPAPGHMGILLNRLGPEPIIRLQAGGLRAAEYVFRGGASDPDGIAHLI